jgi:signal transduction histidine kinase/DNA-binding response OmpR family regulator/ligand-binding sensor domain-containing protein
MQITEDGSGHIWVLTSVGYCIYDPLTESFNSDIASWYSSKGIKGKPSHVIADNKRNLWFTVDSSACYYYDFKKASLRSIIEGKSKGMLPRGDVTDIKQSGSTLYFSYNNGLLVAMDIHSHKVLWTDRYVHDHNVLMQRYYRLFIDRASNCWVFTGENAYVRSSKTHEWKTLNVMVSDILQDATGRIWLATDHNGLVILDANGNQQRTLTNNQSVASVPGNTIRCLYGDNTGTIWVGTYKNGLACHYEGQSSFNKILLGDVCCVTEDKIGNLWCGTNDKGIVAYNRLTHQIINVGKSQSGLGSDIITCALRAHDGSLWFGSYRGGMSQMKGGHWRSFRESNGRLASDDIWSLAEGPDGCIYIGTLGAGLQIYNPLADTFTTITLHHGGLGSDYISSLFFGKDGNLYISHSNDFSIYNPRTKKITNVHGTRSGQKFSSTIENQIFMDSRGLLWIAAISGLNVYDPRTDQLTILNMSSINTKAEYNGITEDNQGWIWTSFSNMLGTIHVTKSGGKWKFETTTFNEADGLQSQEFNKRSLFSSSDGSIIAGDFDGISIISPHRFWENRKPVDVIFSGLVIFDHFISTGEKYNGRIVLKQSLNEEPHIKIKNGEYSFAVQLAATNLSVPERVRFRYRILSAGKRWMLTPEDYSSITFTNLSSGNYDIEVQAIDINGNELSKVRVLHIYVAPPFYRSTLACLFYLLLIIGLVLYFMRDMKRRRIRMLRRTEEKKQREVEAMKQKFFINVGHELRSPLTLIISPLPKMIKEESDNVLREKLRLIQRNSHQLLAMVNKMLDFRRLMMNAEKLHLGRGEIVTFTRSICDQFLSLTNKHITLTFYSSVEKLTIDFDRDKFGAIIYNLLSNAFKFTPNGGRVDVSLKNEELRIKNEESFRSEERKVKSEEYEGNEGFQHSTSNVQPSTFNVQHSTSNFLVLRVADNGINISDDDKRHIFDRFYQADGNEQEGGSGIGLNIVKSYVDMMHGAVTVADNPGGGVVFIVSVPIVNAESAGGEFVTSAESESASVLNNIAEGDDEASSQSSAARLPLPKLLLVDDSDDFLQFMEGELAPYYAITTAHNGEEAMTLIAADRPDIVLTDVMMPVMNGNELCRRIKADSLTASLPVIMLTARLAEENEIESRKCGADDYIVKPFNLELIHIRIDNLLKRKKLNGRTVIEPQLSEVQITSVDEKMVRDATAHVEKNISDVNLSVETLSEALCMSRVKLYRRLLSVTGQTPSEFIRLIRLRRAEQLIVKSQLSVSEISYMVGFSNPRYFSKCYKELFGYLPSQYKKKD